MSSKVKHDPKGSNEHLSDEHIALYVDHMLENRLSELPESIIWHVEECEECKLRILELHEIMAHLGENDLIRQDKPMKKIGNRWQLVLSIAAVVVLLIAVGFIISKISLNQKDVFAEYFQPYPDIITTKNSVDDPVDKLFLQGLSFYSQQMYDTAYALLKNIDEDYTRHDFVKFYLAQIALSQRKNLNAAEEELRELSQKNSTLTEQSTWYLALTLIALGKSQEALIPLEWLINNNTAYHDQAKKLKGELE